MESPSPIGIRLAGVIAGLACSGRVTVAFDGPDTAGKTRLADDVAVAAPIPVCRASIDGFHAPAAIRRRRGDLSPEGYYQDSFDYAALTARLLAPFRSGAAEVETAIFEHRTDKERRSIAHVEPDSALLFDGVFLLRPELREQWTLRIYLQVSEQQILARALQRDVALFGSPDAVVERYLQRYLPGQTLYRDEAAPLDVAHIVIDNDDPAAPKIRKWQPPTP